MAELSCVAEMGMDGQDKRVVGNTGADARENGASDIDDEFAAKPHDSIVLRIVDAFAAGAYAGKEPYLEVEDGREVFYRGDYVTQIVFDRLDELIVGRRDVMAGHYPDIDLAMYRKTDKSISRRHLRFYFNMHGAFFAEDLCNNNATFLGGYGHVLNRECVELKPGDRIIVSRSVTFVFKIR